MLTTKYIKLLVDNMPGVLNRVTGIIRRHGWNIESLSVSKVTAQIARMNFTISGKAVDIDILSRYFSNLEFVRSWDEYTTDEYLFRELVVMRVKESDAFQGDNCRVLEKIGTEMVIEFSGCPDEVDSFLAKHAKDILDCDRSGAIWGRSV